MVLFWRLYLGALLAAVVMMKLTGWELPESVSTTVAPVILTVSLLEQIELWKESRWRAR